MAGIITVEQLEIALGRTLTPTEAAQAQYYIDSISAAVETYTGTTFTLQEDVTKKMQADTYGVINLPMRPVQDVTIVTNDTSVVLPGTGNFLTEPFWGYDGYGQIYNLAPGASYQVTLSYGYVSPPEDMQAYVTEACRGVINNPNGLSSFRIGDVTETYGNGSGNSGQGGTQMGGLLQDALESYRESNETWRLGYGQGAVCPPYPFVN